MDFLSYLKYLSEDIKKEKETEIEALQSDLNGCREEVKGRPHLSSLSFFCL